MHNYNSLACTNTAPRCSEPSTVSKAQEPECKWPSSESRPRWRKAEEHGKAPTLHAIPSCKGVTAAGSALRGTQEQRHWSCHLSAPKVSYLKGKEGGTQEHTDRHLPLTAQGDPELTVCETPWSLTPPWEASERLRLTISHPQANLSKTSRGQA